MHTKDSLSSRLHRESVMMVTLLKSVPAALTITFVLVVIGMNFLSRITLVSLPWLALNAGILISWLSFLFMDIVTKHYGAKAANKLAMLAIAANLCIPYYTSVELPFVGPILISTIQLGATVDYAILMTTRYKQNRLSGMDKREAVEKAVASSAQSILVSGFGFFAATYGVGLYANVDIISSMCRLIARGALLSVAVVLLLLPAVLLLLDKVIVHSTFDMKAAR